MRQIVELFIRWIHLIAAIVWFCGIFFSVSVATPILRKHFQIVESIQHTAAIRDRLRIIIRVAIHVVLITGVMNFFIVGLNTRMEFSPDYVVRFTVKMGFVALMVLFHSLYISVFGRGLQANLADLKPDDSTVPPSIVKLERRTNICALLTIISGMVVLALALSLRAG